MKLSANSRVDECTLHFTQDPLYLTLYYPKPQGHIHPWIENILHLLCYMKLNRSVYQMMRYNWLF